LLNSNPENSPARLRRTLAAVVVLLLVGASAAIADSAAISVTTTTGVSDPVASVPRVVTASGVASEPERIYVKYRTANGAPCAPSSSGDSGTVLGSLYAESVDGAFSLQDVLDWGTPGDVMFCIWLSTGNAETITTPITQLIAFRAPRGSISATVAPTMVLQGREATIKVTGSTEAPAALYARVRVAGRSPCAPTFGADTGRSLLEGAQVDGMFSLDMTTTQAKAGRYLLCLWVARSPVDPAPITGPQATTFRVAAPPVRCIVPSVGSDRRPVAVRRRLRAAHCSIGRTRHMHSRTVRKGAVIRLGRVHRTRLAAYTPIDLVVSSGPQHRLHR
jgi:hypothetical protein